MVRLIMKIAPLGVFALLCTVVSDLGKDAEALGELLWALATYMFTVVLALVLHGALIYGFLLHFVAKVSFPRFLKAMAPAQLLAFSSSSSAATPPLTIVLVQINVPPTAIALILGVDRPLDMCRTVLNVTGDATVATVVASSENAIDKSVLGGGSKAA